MKNLSYKNLKIIFEDNHLIAVNKPSNLLTQGDYSGDITLFKLVKEYIKVKYNKPGNVYLGMLHRLDRPVSGTILFAKTSKAASRLTNEIKKHQTRKFYLAITDSSEHTSSDWRNLNNYLLRIKDKTFISKQSNKNTQSAKLLYKTLIQENNLAINLIELVTGRKHQIRAQLENIKMPIYGDKKYSSNKHYNHNEIALHAYSLQVNHPTKKNRLILNSSIPEHMYSLIKRYFSKDSFLEILDNEFKSIQNNEKQSIA